MRRVILAALLAVAPLSAAAQTAPNFTYGQVPTVAQWNALFAGKQDYLGSPPLLTAGGTMTGPLITSASTTSRAGFNLPPGAAPTAPNDGDLWSTTGGLYVRVNGATIGPLASASAGTFLATSPVTVSVGAGTVTYACPTCGVTGSPLSQFASTTSAQLAGVISNETGSGLLVFNAGASMSALTVTGSFTATGLVTAADLFGTSGSGGNVVLATAPTISALTVTSSFTATGLVGNASLANPSTTVNGQTCTLGSTCTVVATATAALTFGTHLTSGGSSYNGSTAVTITSDATNLNTVSTIVARDGSGNFVAGTITASLTGHASLDLALTSLGTGVQTALGVNVGSAGAVVLFNGAGGTPTSMVGTNITGTASGLTAGASSTATIADDTTTNASMLLAWVTTNTGNLPIKVTSTKLTFNPSTGVLSSTGFAGAGTGLTGTAAGLTAGNVTTNANLIGAVTSTGNATLLGSFSSASLAAALTDETGSGLAVFGTNAALTTPAIAGGTISGLTALAVRDTSAAFDVTIAATSSAALSAGRTLTLNVGNVAHTLALGSTANTITFPNLASYTVITNGDTGTVTNAMLAGSIAASKLIGSDIATVGTLTAGATGAGFTIALGSSTVTGLLALANGGSAANLTASNGGVVYSTASAFAILAGTVTAGQCLLSGSNAAPTWGSCSGGGAAVSAVANIDGTLTISPTTGSVVASLNLANANTWTAVQTHNNSAIRLLGSSTGYTVFTSANSGVSNFTLTFPAVTSTLAALGLAQTWTVAQTFTNSTILLLGSSTGATTFTSANAGASNFTATVPANTGTLAMLNLAQTWSAAQSFGSGNVILNGSGSGSTILNAAAAAGSTTITLPAATDTVAVLAAAQSLSNKTLVSPALSGTVTGAGTIPLSILATQGADTVTMNNTGGTASPSAAALTSCSAASSALTYNTTTHAFGCNTISSAGLSSKTNSFTRVLSVASGSISYTGYGFQPTSCEFWTAVTGSFVATSSGSVDSAKAGRAFLYASNSSTWAILNGAVAIYLDDPTAENGGAGPPNFSNYQSAVISSYDADGFTLAYTKVGTPTVTATVNVTCYK